MKKLTPEGWNVCSNNSKQRNWKPRRGDMLKDIVQKVMEIMGY